MKEFKIEDLTLDILIENDGEILKIIQRDIDFYYKVHLRENNDKLIVCSNGAIDPSRSSPPIFMRSKWFEEFEANCIFVDDRTVHGKNLRIGWGIGTAERHYLRSYIAFVKKISTLLEITNKNIMYYGSSAGGFMSMAMASMHKGTYAVVNNPQTYVNKYLRQYVTAVYKKIFPEMTEKEILKKYSHRFSITNIFAKNKNVPKIFYLQNRLCKMDMEKHLKPFLHNMDKYNLSTNTLNVVLYNNKISGHNPLGKKRTVAYINNILNGHPQLF